MNALSNWASQHVRMARFLIAIIELLNCLLGLTLGAGLWTTDVLPDTASAMPLHSLTLLLIGAVFYLRFLYLTNSHTSYEAQLRMKRWCMVGLFYLNFLLYALLGGLWAHRTTVFHPSGALGSYHRVEAVRDSIGPAKGLKQERMPVSISARKDPSLTMTRIGYGLLFLLSLGLAYVAMFLACSLACSGQGFFAVVVLLLATGIVGTGLYFLGRAFTPDMKLYREMTTAERKREGRRLRRSWLLGVLLLIVLPLFVNTVNSLFY